MYQLSSLQAQQLYKRSTGLSACYISESITTRF